MTLRSYEYKQFGESFYYGRIKDRLPMYYIQKPGFTKSYVTLSLPLGSIHRGYMDTNGFHDVPRGIAHFLEHKVFEKDGMDRSREFSIDEASINAFTEHHQTTYLFTTANHVKRNTKRLIDMVFRPQFSNKGIENEKKIITEELNMHLDDPGYKQYVGLMNNLYVNHPLKDDILGTKEDILSMHSDDLTSMHEAYYRPERAALVVVSALDPYTFFEELSNDVILPPLSDKAPKTVPYDEPSNVGKASEDVSLDVRMPSTLFGIKFSPSQNADPFERIKTRMALSMWLDLAFGRSSDTYESLMDQGVINDSYALELNYTKDFAYALIGSETSRPAALKEALGALLENPSDITINEADFKRLKRQMIGSFIHVLDSPENIAHQFANYVFEGVAYYDLIEAARAITFDMVVGQANTVHPGAISVHTILNAL